MENGMNLLPQKYAFKFGQTILLTRPGPLILVEKNNIPTSVFVRYILKHHHGKKDPASLTEARSLQPFYFTGNPKKPALSLGGPLNRGRCVGRIAVDVRFGAKSLPR